MSNTLMPRDLGPDDLELVSDLDSLFEVEKLMDGVSTELDEEDTCNARRVNNFIEAFLTFINYSLLSSHSDMDSKTSFRTTKISSLERIT
jgi:hypothetical protein